MILIDKDIIEWLDYNVPLGCPPLLKENAPEYIKIKYEELKKFKSEQKDKGIWA